MGTSATQPVRRQFVNLYRVRRLKLARRNLRATLRRGRPVTFGQRVSRDLSSVLCTRILGVVAEESRLTPLNAKFFTRLLFLYGSPVIIALAQDAQDIADTQKRIYFFWLLYFVAIGISSTLVFRGLMVASMRMWPELEASLTRDGLNAYRYWSNTNASIERQVLLLLPVTVMGVTGLWVVRYTRLADQFYIAFPSFLSVIIAGSVVGNATYWLIRGVQLSRLLGRVQNFNLIWVAPARTPVVESLAKVYRIAFYLAVLQTATYLFPVIWLVNRNATADPIFLIMKLVFLGLALLGVLVVAILPQLWLSAVVAWHRTAGIKRAQRMLEEKSASRADEIAVASLIKTIADSPSSTINDRTIVGIVLGASAAVGPTLVQILSR